MGRHRRKPMKRERKAVPSADGTKEDAYYDDGRVVIRENRLFEEFYKAQQFVTDDEWNTLMESLRKDLPSSFRLVGCRKEAMILKKLLKERFLSKMGDTVVDGVPVSPPAELSWYPGGMGYQMTLPRNVVRKQPILSAFHNFLVTETEMGNVSRQETVSMIPPLLLDVQPHHKVLDMCAAPGSKTAQLIEMLHSADEDDGSTPSGFVLANDADNKRCYLLVHQSLKRLSSPCCLISNMDAACMPNVQMLGENQRLQTVQFDRILCDVPCSGDGTLRKNVSIWKEWSLYHAYNLHKMQFRIAKRALEMLAVDGIMVYSTCSFNPAEDEATVYRLLEFAGGAVELVDVSDKLPGLERHPGLHTWTIMDKKGNKISSYDDVPKDLQRQIPPDVFPPPLKLAQEAHLERCFRILPHDQDTGGFFVAVLKKPREIHSSRVPQSAEVDGTGDHTGLGQNECSSATPPAKKPRYSGFKEDPFTFVTDGDPWWDGVKQYFDVRDDFPRSQLLCRCSDQRKKRNVYFVNEAIKQIIQNNGERIKFINAGLRLFTKSEEKEGRFHYRLAQESLRSIVPFMRQRVVELVEMDDVVKLLLVPSVLLDDFSPSTRSLVENLSEGSLAIVFKQPSEDHVIMLSSWRGKVSVAAYVSQENRVHILRLLGHDTSSLEEEMVRQRKKQNVEPVEEGMTGQEQVEKTTSSLEKVENGATKVESVGDEVEINSS